MSDTAFSELKAAFAEAIDLEKGKRGDLCTTKRYATKAEFQSAVKKLFSKHSRMNKKLATG